MIGLAALSYPAALADSQDCIKCIMLDRIVLPDLLSSDSTHSPNFFDKGL